MKTMKTIAAVMIAALAVTASPVSAVTSNGPYYPTPSWDQQLTCASAANCPRFVVLSNWIDLAHPSGGAAVLDRESGLVWERSPSTLQQTWENAQVSCNLNRVGNRLGWRLPTVQELASLVDPTQSNPALPAGHPFSNVQFSGSPPFSYYWSATSGAGSLNNSNAWMVLFYDQGGVTDDAKTLFHFVWCVRGGHGVDPQ